MKEGYYLRVQGMLRGPFTLEQLQTMRTRGQLQRYHEISRDKKAWIPAGSVIELFAVSTAGESDQTIPEEPETSSSSSQQSAGRFSLANLRGPALAFLQILYQYRRPLAWSGGAGALLLVGTLLVLWLKKTPALTADSSPNLSEAAVQLLQQHCAECHGKERKGSNKKFDILDRPFLVSEQARKPKMKYLTPNDPEQSAIWKRIENDDMPAEGDPLSPEAKQILKRWISAGAEFPAAPSRPSRPRISDHEVLERIDKIVENLAVQDDPKNMRFFVLNHLHNNRSLSQQKLNLYRAALSKILNSVSKQAEIVRPKDIGLEGAVFQINLLDYGLDAQKWEDLTAKYVYGIDEDDPAAKLRLERIRRRVSTKIFALRADWFIANASKPPLYHDLLGIPERLNVLETELNVKRIFNIQQNRVDRAGFHSSGVSKQNRIIERHLARDGYYWFSYDFKEGNNDRNDIMKFPLGPKEANLTPGNQELHFVADGGEVIFSLPNNLQGYMLVNGGGIRIDEGPEDVVTDSTNSSGTYKITNGLSCFSCHKDGLREKYDEVQESAQVRGLAKDILTKLYRSKKELERIFDKDNKRYRAALEECYKGFLSPAERTGKEPIVYCYQEFRRSLDITTAALELGVDPEEMKNVIKANKTLRSEISALANNGKVSRENWERVFPEVVSAVGHGIPVRQ